MVTLTIRNVSETVHKALRLRAAENGRSVEEEVRRILAERTAGRLERKSAKTAGEVAAAAKRLQSLFAQARRDYSVEQFVREKHDEARREFAEDGKEFNR